ncbi:MAG: glycosyltransferase family 2 protein [Chitinophagaceae bacterium]|nr:glycosyltransferase family 2 protein [Chitinophagaceae bacterium]
MKISRGNNTIMQASSPLVTVGILTYNRPEGLERTLISIINQTYKNISILVSDNCSTNPDVLPILKKYAELDNRVTFIVQKKNLSLVPNFQFLLDQAGGKYFMWAADDDQWSTGFIEACVLAMEANDDVAITMTTMDIFDEAGKFDPGKLNRSFYSQIFSAGVFIL